MGFWGTALFSNDTTCDVRDTYKGLLSDQMSNEEAYAKTMEQFSELIGTDEEPLFWYAFAETQWRVGRLLPEVKDKALEWLERGGGLDLWEDDQKGQLSWLKTLQKLQEKLESPMPKEKRFPKLDQNPWNLHDVYAYQLHGEYAEEKGYSGKYMLLQKIGDFHHNLGGRICALMQIHTIDHVFDAMPCLENVNEYRILPIENLTGPSMAILLKSTERPLRMNGCTYIGKPSDYPFNYLTFLGNMPGPVNNYFVPSSVGWGSLDVVLCRNHLFWQGKEYREVENGIYDISAELASMYSL